MKASLRSVRIAPKKAQVVAKMIRGKSVPDALYSLERTNKKAARILEDLLRSAIANASHNENQDAQTMIVKTLIVNQAQAYHRGIPMSRGRVRPIRKFLSHISLTLGIPVEKGEKKAPEAKKTKEKKAVKASQKAKSPVKKATSSPKKTTKSTGVKSEKDNATSDSQSAVSEKYPKSSS